MSKFKCLTCFGTYDSVQKGGMEYFHACPPVQIADEKYKERPDKRDENYGQKLAGKGRAKIVDNTDENVT